MGILDRLAPELQRAIYERLDKRSLCAVGLTNKTIYGIAMPVLYETVIVDLFEVQVRDKKERFVYTHTIPRELYRRKYYAFLRQSEQMGQGLLQPWISYIRSLRMVKSADICGMVPEPIDNPSIDILSSLGSQLEDGQLRSLLILYGPGMFQESLRPPKSTLFNQCQLRAIGLVATSYELLQQTYIPFILQQPRLTSLILHYAPSKRQDVTAGPMVSMLASLSDTLITLGVTVSLVDQREVYTEISRLRRLEQLALWANSRSGSFALPLIVGSPGMRSRLKWLAADIGQVRSPFDNVGPLSIQSIQLSGPFQNVQEILGCCRGLRTIDWMTKNGFAIDAAGLFETHFVTRHWETLTRLYLDSPRPEFEIQLWCHQFLSEILNKCVNLIELGVSIPSTVKFHENKVRWPLKKRRRTAYMMMEKLGPFFQFLNSTTGISGLRRASEVAEIEVDWPEVSNNLRCLHLLNSRVTGGLGYVRNEHYWDALLPVLLDRSKKPFFTTEGSVSVPLPCLQAVITGSFNRDRGGIIPNYPMQAWKVTDNISELPISEQLGDLRTAEKVTLEELRKQYPGFHGFKYHDHSEIWADENGKFWD